MASWAGERGRLLVLPAERLDVARVQIGDREAFAALYRPYHRLVYYVAWRIVQNNAGEDRWRGKNAAGEDLESKSLMAEDTTAQTFLKALENFGRFRGDACVRNWLCAIARNEAWTIMRQGRPALPPAPWHGRLDDLRLRAAWRAPYTTDLWRERQPWKRRSVVLVTRKRRSRWSRDAQIALVDQDDDAEGHEVQTELEPAIPSPENDYIIRMDVARLPATLRAAVTLCDLDGLSRMAAAATLGVSLEALKKRLYRGRLTLRRKFATKS